MSSPQPLTEVPGWQLWDNDSGNIMATFTDIETMVRFAFSLGQANPTALNFVPGHLTVIAGDIYAEYAHPLIATLLQVHEGDDER